MVKEPMRVRDVNQPLVLLFVKAPVRGFIKSRLAEAIGDDAALDLYKNFCLDEIQTLKRAGYPFRIFCFPPDAAGSVSEWLGREHSYEPQLGNDLGERMENAFRSVFSRNCERAVLVGSDIPDLSESMIQDAFRGIEQNGMAIGPAGDGGYYLIGFRRGSFEPCLFHGIDWSTAGVYAETMRKAESAGLNPCRLPAWNDVDTVTDLKALFVRNHQTRFAESSTMEYLKAHPEILTSDAAGKKTGANSRFP